MNTVYSMTRFAALLVFVGLTLTGGQAMAIEEPGYKVLKTWPDFELRQYPPQLLAETEVAGSFDGAGNQAFRILAGYIFGDNLTKTKIEMTAPVNQRPAGERIEMTAPVAQRPVIGSDGGRYVISFVMPSRFTLDTLPQPRDARVKLREEPAQLMAVRRYSGRWTEANYRENETRLLAGIAEAGLRPIGEPVYARYNSPFALWFTRRNEVMVEVAAPPG